MILAFIADPRSQMMIDNGRGQQQRNQMQPYNNNLLMPFGGGGMFGGGSLFAGLHRQMEQAMNVSE